MIPPRTVVDESFQDVSDNIDDRGGRLDGPSIINGINVGRMVIEEMREMASDEANFSADNYPGPVKQIARELRRAWAENNAKPVEERESCQVPGCQCNGRADYMDWNSDDMTETELFG